jgi:hypothetical protein
MLANIDKLKAELAKWTPEELKLQFSAAELAEIDYTLRDALCAERVASFDAGPLYFLTRLTQTENPQHEKQGVSFKAPFPRKSYFVPLFQEFLQGNSITLIPKSRTMMTSWAAMGLSFWDGQWNKGETVVQTANEDKCAHLIDYCRQLWENQEPWLKQRHPLIRCSTFAIAWEGGGEVASIPSGADKIRMYHPKRYIMDEAAFLPEGEECLNAVLPTGAEIVAISSARAGWFGDMCER